VRLAPSKGPYQSLDLGFRQRRRLVVLAGRLDMSGDECATDVERAAARTLVCISREEGRVDPFDVLEPTWVAAFTGKPLPQGGVHYGARDRAPRRAPVRRRGSRRGGVGSSRAGPSDPDPDPPGSTPPARRDTTAGAER
jgi:hypothetical protein